MTTGSEITSPSTPNKKGSGKKVLVVGATSSLAESMCRTLAQQGYGLILAGRDENELSLLASDMGTRYGVTCKRVAMNFLDTDFSPEILLEKAGDFDHAIIAAGSMGGSDTLDLSNIAFTMHLNYTLPAQIATLTALQLARRHESDNRDIGSLVIISSVAGDRGRQSNYAYGSAKAALSAFASGLRNAFFRKGVHVMTVKPGFIDTPMTWGMQSPLIASREYVAEKIVAAMHKRKNVIYVPFFWRYIMLIIIHIPETIFKRLSL